MAREFSVSSASRPQLCGRQIKRLMQLIFVDRASSLARLANRPIPGARPAVESFFQAWEMNDQLALEDGLEEGRKEE